MKIFAFFIVVKFAMVASEQNETVLNFFGSWNIVEVKNVSFCSFKKH